MRDSNPIVAAVISLAALLTAACGDHPVASSDAVQIIPALSVLENEWQPFAWQGSACHEPLLVEGKSHITLSAQSDGNRWLFSWHQQVVGSGVGEFSGRTYHLSETYVGTETVAEGGTYPLSLTYLNRVTLIGQGALADILGQWRWHLTINANGDATAQVEEATFECGEHGPPGFEGTLVVNVVDDLDDGSCGPTHCSLREALNAANEQPGMNTVAFRIPGPGPHTIRPNEGLPPLFDPVIIDGTSEPHFAGTPVIELDGSGINGEAHGLVLLAGNTTVRGLVINRFSLNGILIDGPDASGNVVEGNYIGTDVTGTETLGNGLHGVSIVNAPGNLVGGATAAARNLISGNAFHGVEIVFPGSSGNSVQGNYIGTDASGTSALGNGEQGVLIVEAPGTLVGGVMPGAVNVISGNAHNGVAINSSVSTGNMVQGNHIGTDVTGTVALGNGNAGVMLAGSTGNLVGGTAPGAGNLISGNLEGVTFDAGFGNLVQGNLIGTDAGGTLAIPNGTGILLLGHENTIGGIEPAARNVISGSIDNGITLDLGAGNNEIMGNLIGTDVTGTVALGNGSRGIYLNDAYDNTIGGGARGAPNVISGNRTGISLSGGASGNAVRGNLIGTDVSGTEPLGNARAGVLLSTEASGNPIGGRRAGSGNVIAFNGAAGIRLVNSAGAGNALEGNSILGNVGLGIDLGGPGVTDNDLLDEDDGPNHLQNFPVVETVDPSAVVGYLHSSPDTQFRIQFFVNETCDPTGHGEGETVLGFTTVTTDGNGDAAFTFFVSVPLGSFVTATATDPTRSTSEFSACVPNV